MENRDAQRARAKRIRRYRSFALLLLIGLSAVIIFDYVSSAKTFHTRIWLGDHPVGGQTRSSVKKYFDDRVEDYLGRRIVLNRNGREFGITPSQLGARIAIEKSIDDAFNIEKKCGLFEGIWMRILLLLKGERIPLRVSFNGKILARGIMSVNHWIDQLPVEAKVEKSGTSLTIDPSRSGFSIDKPYFIKKIYEGLSLLKPVEIAAKTVVWQPDITNDEAEQAVFQARQDCQVPLYMSFNGEETTFDREKLWELLTFDKIRSKKNEFILVPSLEKTTSFDMLKNFLKKFNVESVDAKFEVDGPDVSIIPAKNGRVYDITSSYSRLLKAFRDPRGERGAVAVLRKVKPKKIVKDLAAMKIETRLSTYTTEFESSNTPRVNNIAKVAEELDGTIVAPGELFSFNKTTGPRTKEQGYKEAPVIVRGELRPGIGGGVCQVATTMFNAIFFAGLPVMERHPHYFYISHYPPGRDAAVYYGGYDLKFRNDTGSHLLIKSFPSSDSVTISIYGKRPKRTVDFITSDFFDFVNPSTRNIKDATLLVGTTKVEQSSEQGRSISVRRSVSLREKILFKNTFLSQYSPKDSIIKVGTKPKPSSSFSPVTGRSTTAAVSR